ncbi:hypothetical protein MKX03_008349 [Papaver bracteatum]|nr:hypothetical protein MKX03_008349 [Papaver bracteatum]
MRELRNGVRRGRSAAGTDDHNVCGEVTAAKTNVLEVEDYNNPIIVEEEEPDEDQSNRTPPSTPYENAGMGKLEHLDILLNIIVRLPVKSILRFRYLHSGNIRKSQSLYAKQDSFYATSFVYVESLVALNSGTYVGEVDEDSENDYESEGEGEDEANDTGAKRERPQRWVHAAGAARTVDLDSTNSGAHVERGDSKDDNDSEQEEEGEEGEEMRNGVPASPKPVNEATETSPEKSRDKYNHYVEEYMDLKRRKLDLQTKELELKHMSLDTSKMNALQLKWWQMGAEEIAQKRGF